MDKIWYIHAYIHTGRYQAKLFTYLFLYATCYFNTDMNIHVQNKSYSLEPALNDLK